MSPLWTGPASWDKVIWACLRRSHRICQRRGSGGNGYYCKGGQGEPDYRTEFEWERRGKRGI